jgi:carbamoyl-phosphate synthase small subunit
MAAGLNRTGNNMKLVLADGSEFGGRSFGADKTVRGEVVFNTGLVGYVETLTDPSYCGQILVMTYPLQGNYGVPSGSFESSKIQVQGLVVHHHTAVPSHHASTQSLGSWLKSSGVPAIEGVDTRTITRLLREVGTMDGGLVSDSADRTVLQDIHLDGVEMRNAVDRVVPREMERYPGKGPKILLIDTGAKENIIRSLSRRGASVIRAPYHLRWEDTLDEVDGVVLANGPGDPKDLKGLIERLRVLPDRGVPVFGICLGHQLLALMAGADTYKLKYGHRSHNQPVLNLTTQRAYVTSQNHGYAVVEESLPVDWEPWFINLNDGTNEGIRHRFRPLCSVQFHPEAAAGPRDTAFLFDDFLRTVAHVRETRSGKAARA